VPVELVCEFCDSEYSVKPSRADSSRFCSTNCKASWQSENNTGENHPNWSRKEVTCENCNETFEKLESRIERSDNNFCSDACRKDWWSEYCKEIDYSGIEHHNWGGGSVLVKCENCGEEVEVSQTRRDEYTNSFCSQKCYGEWLSENISGENHPQYKEDANNQINYRGAWKKQSSKARDRDGGCCHCDMSIKEHEEKYGFKPPVHHIERYKSFEEPKKANKLENLITLCCKHHRQVEEDNIEVGNNE